MIYLLRWRKIGESRLINTPKFILKLKTSILHFEADTKLIVRFLREPTINKRMGD